MMLVEILTIAAVLLALAHVVRTMQTMRILGNGDPGFRPGKPCDPRLLRDPITMSWDE